MTRETTFETKPKRRRRIVGRVFRLLIVSYLSVLIFMVMMESRLVFPGAYFGRDEFVEESDIVTVDTDPADDLVVPARLLERPDPEHHVLFLHGNGVSATQLDRWTQRLSRSLNATVLTAEYRGYTDDRTPTEAGVIADAEAAFHLLQTKYDLTEEEIVIYGRSLGGGCAAAVAVSRGAKVVILDRTFDAAWRVAASKYPFIPVNLLMRNRFDSVARLAGYPGPVVQLHGTTDSLIPIEHGRALFDQLRTEDKVWIEVPGMEHNDRMSDQLLRRVANEVQRLTNVEELTYEID